MFDSIHNKVEELNHRPETKHHYTLYKRHLFADLLTLAHSDVRYFRSDFYCDALQLEHHLPRKPEQSIILWYAWRDTGTHMWIQDERDPQYTGKFIRENYLQYDQLAVKIYINPCLNSTWGDYVTFYYSVAKD